MWWHGYVSGVCAERYTGCCRFLKIPQLRTSLADKSLEELTQIAVNLQEIA